MKKAPTLLLEIYRELYTAFGPQHWWPGETPIEIIVGAVLTQNTAWTNVARAIANLKAARLLSVAGLRRVDRRRLARLIRPSGYFNQKAARLKAFIEFLDARYGGRLSVMARRGTAELRRALLGVTGIGPETADSILLYAFGRPVFVVDAYTRRVAGRHGLIGERASYDEVQGYFTAHLPRSARLYNEYHALLVRVGKDFCRRAHPLCAECPLRGFLPKGEKAVGYG